MSKITYENKEAINVDTSIPNKNKGTADDFNEIKNSVNALYDEKIYSTSEVLTNKVWLGGKPIYRKTIIIPGPFTSNAPTIDISSLGAETIMIDSTHSFARFVDSVDDYTIPFDSPACSTGTVAMKAGAIAITDINHYTDEIELYIGSNSLNDSTMILYITLEYTKATQNQSNTPVITPPPDPTPEEEN